MCRKNLYTHGVRQIADNVSTEEVLVNQFLFLHHLHVNERR